MQEYILKDQTLKSNEYLTLEREGILKIQK